MEEKREEKESKSWRTTTIMANSVAFPDEIPMSFAPPPVFSGIFDIMPPSSSSCDQPENQKPNYSFGFMDLLGLQDYSPSLFDWLPSTASDVFNTPPSPTLNSSSISSSSNDAPLNNITTDEPQSSGKAGNEREPEDEDIGSDAARGDDHQHQPDPHKTNKQ